MSTTTKTVSSSSINNMKGAASMKTYNNNQFLSLVINAVVNEFNKQKAVSVKTGLIIMDLEEASSHLNYPQSNFNMCSEEEMFDVNNSEFDNDKGADYKKDNLSFEEMTGLSSHDGEYFLQQESYYAEENAEKQKAYELSTFETNKLEVLKVCDIKDMSDEIKCLIGSQIACSREFGDGALKSDNDIAYVQVQRLSDNGNWYNAKYKDGSNISFAFNLSDIFVLNDSGHITNLVVTPDMFYKQEGNSLVKVTEDRSVVYPLMAKLGHTVINSYQAYNVENGDFSTRVVEQRFLVSTKAFGPGSMINGESVPTVVAPFFYAVDPETKEVHSQFTSYAYDAVMEIDSNLVLLPTDWDESHGQAGNRSFNAGILCGNQIATQAMMYDDVLKFEIEQRRDAEIIAFLESSKTRTNSKFSKKMKVINNKKALVKNNLEGFMKELIELSEQALHMASAARQIEVILNDKADMIKEIRDAARAYKAIHGKGLATPTFRIIESKLKVSEVRKVKAEVHPEAAKTIAILNDAHKKGVLDFALSKVSDEVLVGTYEAARDYYQTVAIFKLELEVARIVKDKYAVIKGIKVSTPKPRNSVVRNIKVG